MPGAVVDHFTVDDGDQIAPVPDLVVGQCDIKVCCLKRRASGHVLCRVITHERHVADVGTGAHPIGDRLDQSRAPVLGQVIHIRGAGRLQRRFIPKFLDGHIGRAVRNDNDIFHRCFPTIFTSVLESPLRDCSCARNFLCLSRIYPEYFCP